MMNNLINLRKSRNLTQKDVAKILGISYQAYSNYELGNREPDFKTLKILSDYFEVSIDFLLDWKHPNKNSIDTEDSELSEIKSIFEQLSPDNRAKLLELSNLYLSAQHKSEENK